MQDALQDLQNEFGEIAASFAVSSGPFSAIMQLGGVVGLAARHAAQCPTQVL